MNANDVIGGLVAEASGPKWYSRKSDQIWTQDRTTHIANMTDESKPGDIDLIVAAVNALPLLLEVVAKARGETDRACAEHGACPSGCDCWCCVLQSALARLDEGVRP